MVKRKFIISCLRAVAKAAEKYAFNDPELTKALWDLDEAEKQSDQNHKKELEAKGIDCVVCGKRFLPFPDNYSSCCSIGCRFSD